MNSMSRRLEEPDAQQSPPRRGGRRWLFRIAAVLVGISPLLLFEGLCIAFDWGRASLHDDPFIGFHSVGPLFVKSEDGSRYEIPKARQTHFRPDSFPAKKGPNVFRIFSLGGSTVQGRPFAIETAYSTWLRISLQAADPQRRFESVNCGGISYASYRLVPILEEVLGYEPDLIILDAGHNEFLEDRTFDHIAGRGRLVNASLKAASRLRTFTLLREGYLRLHGTSSSDPPESRPILPTEVEALLDYRGGLEAYHHDDAWRRGVIAQYRYNMRRMVALTRNAGVDMILVNPVSNIRSSPPFKSEHRADLSSAELAEWETTCEAAHEHARRGNHELHTAIRLFERACRIDPLHAGGFYNLASCHLAAGQLDQARQAYLQAKELDVCPLRILQEMNQAVLEIARGTGTPLLDAQEFFERRSTNQIVGGDWLVDHVHPNIEGHQLLADALTDMLITLGKVRPRPGWEQVKRERYREHFDSLDNLYFLTGQERLWAERGWTHGRARRLRPSAKNPPPQP
jgi:tetratricopeptide (TPR) repeat protein